MDTDLTACSAAAHMDVDTRFNDGPVQASNKRSEETSPCDPAAFIQDLANKVGCSAFEQQYIVLLADQTYWI